MHNPISFFLDDRTTNLRIYLSVNAIDIFVAVRASRISRGYQIHATEEESRRHIRTRASDTLFKNPRIRLLDRINRYWICGMVLSALWTRVCVYSRRCDIVSIRTDTDLRVYDTNYRVGFDCPYKKSRGRGQTRTG